MNKLLLIFVLFTYVLNGQKYKTNNQSLFNSKNKISTTETTNVTVPRLLSYQGLLTKTDGKAIKDGSLQVTFRLYTSLEEGVHFWEEEQNVAIEDGILTAVLGKIIPIDNVPNASFLEVEINGTTLSPRQEMTSSFYSVISDTSKYSQGGNYSDLDGLPDLTIFSSKDTLSNFTLTDSLNPIALSGDYLDLENVPDLSDVLQSDTLNLYVTKDSLNSYVLTSSLSAVATSNNYLDLNNLPNLSQYATKDTLTNFISEDTLSSYALNTELGSIVIQDTNNVNITGGSISGISDMLIADGGTGASDIATARENLGLEIGTDVQGYDADLADLADGSLSVSKVQFLENISSDVQEQINNLGLNSLTDLGVVADSSELNYVDGVTSNIQTQLNNKQELNSNLTTIVNLDKSDGNFIVSDGENWTTESGIDARASLGIGSMGTQQSDNVTISGGRVTDILDIAIADGGTGASDISSARENLGLEIGADIQGYDADLADISGLSQNDGNIIVSNGSSWTAESGTDARASLGLSVGTDVQGYDADLADLADGTLSASKVENNEYFITSPGTANQVWTSDGIGAGEWSASTNTLTGAGSTIDTEDLSTSQAVVTDSNGKIAVSDVTATELNYVDGVTSNIQTQLDAKQLADSDLSDLAGLTQSDGNIIVSDGSNWTAESGSDARTSLGVSIGSDVQAYDADLTDLADGTLSASKVENNEYFITSPGTAGEVWISDGSGAGDWGLSAGITGAASTVDTEDLTGKRALISDIDGKIAISDITSQELRYLDDVSSNVQTQLDGKQALNSNLTDLVGLSQSDGNFIVSDGTNWTAESGSDARASLGLGSLSTQESSTVTITGGSISGITDIDISDGGTGASDIATARENLGLEIGTDVQGYDADLADLADGTLSASKVENNEYFITSPGTANQVWTSDGIGAGEWSASTNTLTGAGSTIDTEDLSTSQAVVTDSNGKIAVSDVTATELSYVDGVTSNIQTQLDAKGTGTVSSLSDLSVTSTATELNILDGVTSTTAELNILDGVTASAAELNYVDGVTSNIQTQLNAKGTGTVSSLSDLSITSTATELNILDGVTATAAELNYVDGVTSNIQTQLNAKGTGTVSSLSDLSITSTATELNILDGVTSTTGELNILDGVTATAAELNYVDGVTSNIQTQLNAKGTGTVSSLSDLSITSTATELNILDGVTSTTGELNILDGVTATAAELNYVDGVTSNIQTQLNAKGTGTVSSLSDLSITSTATELNILDGVTSTTAELNILDGVTATAVELNYVDGVTSNIQTQLDAKGTGTVSSLSDLSVTSTATELNILDGVTSTTAELNVLDGALKETNSIWVGSDPSSTTDVAEYNVAIGTTALNTVTTGDSNTALGYNTLTANLAGNRNTAVGTNALKSNTTGITNVAVGSNALESNTTANSNTAVGHASSFKLASGQNNVTLGYEASKNMTSADNNVIVGSDANPSANTGTSNQIVIGYNTTGKGNNTVTIGNGDITTWSPTDDGEVDLGSSSVEFKDLYVDGVAYTDAIGFGSTAMTLPTADGSNGQVLVTDGGGALSWSSTAGNATTASTLTITDNENTNESNALIFTAGGDVDGGDLGLESDGDATYNPSTGVITATGFSGNLTGTLQTAAQTNITSLGTLSGLTVSGEASVITLDIGGTDVTSTAAELNILDGVTATAAELNYVDGVTSNIQTQLNAKGTGTVSSLSDLSITSTATELNILDGVTSTTGELNILDGVTATAAELNYVDGVTSNIQTQLNAKGTGTVSSLSDLSITSTATELNILDGVTSTTGELNILDGVTATAAELNYVDGVTSNIQTQLDAISGVTGLDGLTDVKSGGSSFSNSLIVGHQTTGTLNNANDNVGLGIGSLESITSGDNNTAIGKDAMSSNTSGFYNVGIGHSALGLNIDGHSNTGVGNLVFNDNTSGFYNVGIGVRALQESTTSGYNVAVGPFALGEANRTADTDGYNTAIGYTSGMTGSNNITTGNKNTLLGAFTALSSGAGTNQIVIGYNTYGKGDNTVTIGNGDITTWTPMDDGEVDLGSSSVEFKNLYIDGTAYLDAVDIDGGAIDGTAIGANSASTGAFTTATASTSLDITGSAGLILENDETITNSSNGTVLVTATTTSLSGDLTVTGNDITFGNGETISNSTDGTVVVTATTIEMAGKTDFDDNAITGYGADLQTLSGTSKTLAATDNGTVIVCSSGSATSISVSSGASLPAGFNCMIVQNGAGQVTFSASGTTLNARNGLKTAGQYAMMTLVHLGSNVFVVSGDTTL